MTLLIMLSADVRNWLPAKAKAHINNEVAEAAGDEINSQIAAAAMAFNMKEEGVGEVFLNGCDGVAINSNLVSGPVEEEFREEIKKLIIHFNAQVELENAINKGLSDGSIL